MKITRLAALMSAVLASAVPAFSQSFNELKEAAGAPRIPLLIETPPSSSVPADPNLPSFQGSLAGRTYSRTINGSIIVGGLRTFVHQLRFADEGQAVVDNANSFFGNPPKRYEYRLVSGKLIVLDQGKRSAVYDLSLDGKTITTNGGAILTIDPASEIAEYLEGKTFTATVVAHSPDGAASTSVLRMSFLKGRQVRSDVGWGPEMTMDYRIDGRKITPINGRMYIPSWQLSEDGQSLTEIGRDGSAGPTIKLAQ